MSWRVDVADHRQLQYYISAMIAFLVIENLGSFAYYRYINKHGGGTSSLIFLVIGVLVSGFITLTWQSPSSMLVATRHPSSSC